MDIRVIQQSSSIFPWAVTVNGVVVPDGQCSYEHQARMRAKLMIKQALKAA